MYWLHWKSKKNRTEPNELDELKHSKSLNQTTSYAYRHIFMYLLSCIQIIIHPIWYQKKNELNKLNELTLTVEQLCSLTCHLVFAINIHAQAHFCIRCLTSIGCAWLLELLQCAEPCTSPSILILPTSVSGNGSVTFPSKKRTSCIKSDVFHCHGCGSQHHAETT